MYVTLSPSEQWRSRKSSPNTMTNDRRKLDPEKQRKWKSHLGSVLIAIQCYQIISNSVLALLLNVWVQPHLPIDSTTSLSRNRLEPGDTGRDVSTPWSYRSVRTLRVSAKYTHPFSTVNTTSCVIPGFAKMMSRYLEWFFRLNVFWSTAVK